MFAIKNFLSIVSRRRLRRRWTRIPIPPPGLDPERRREKFGRDFVGVVARAAELHRREDTDVKYDVASRRVVSYRVVSRRNNLRRVDEMTILVQRHFVTMIFCRKDILSGVRCNVEALNVESMNVK